MIKIGNPFSAIKKYFTSKENNRPNGSDIKYESLNEVPSSKIKCRSVSLLKKIERNLPWTNLYVWTRNEKNRSELEQLQTIVCSRLALIENDNTDNNQECNEVQKKIITKLSKLINDELQCIRDLNEERVIYKSKSVTDILKIVKSEIRNIKNDNNSGFFIQDTTNQNGYDDIKKNQNLVDFKDKYPALDFIRQIEEEFKDKNKSIIAQNFN